MGGGWLEGYGIGGKDHAADDERHPGPARGAVPREARQQHRRDGEDRDYRQADSRDDDGEYRCALAAESAFREQRHTLRVTLLSLVG